MSADPRRVASPSGTGHDTARAEHVCQRCGSDLWTWCDYRGCSICFEPEPPDDLPPVAVPGPASEPERYTISEDRLAEIRALIAHDRYGYRVLPASAQVTALELAAAVDDLLAERDERTDA